MLLHRSFDHSRLGVYAQWIDKEHLESATSDPTVKGAREELDRWARPDGALYSFHSLVSPTAVPLSTLQIEDGALISFVNVWECGDSDRQQRLLAAIKEEAPVISSHKGFLGMALHASLDGRRVGIYARIQERRQP